MKMYIWRVNLDMSIIAFANNSKEARRKVKESWPGTECKMVEGRPRIDKIPDAMVVNLFNCTVDGMRRTGS